MTGRLAVALFASLMICVVAAPRTVLGQGRAGGNTQAFVPYAYTDSMTRMEAFRLLIPKAWRAEGSITWVSNPALPVQSRFRYYNPAGAEELNLYPAQSYFWTDNRMFLATNPPGSLRFYSRVAQPIDLRTAFRTVIIPGVRKNASGLTILQEKEVPELAALARGGPVQGVQSSAQGGKVRIVYREGGREMEEEIYGTVSQFVTHIPSGRGSYFINYWYIDHVFSIRAAKGTLDSQARTFKTMIYSMKINPPWFAKVVNTKEILAQKTMKGIKAIGKIGESVAQAGSKMREDQQRDWERRQQVYDRIARNASDNIRGVDRYYDSRAGKEVELPSGYGTAWANNLGEYVVTESPSYNPNVGSNLHWEQLSPVR
jgi:hypothetical protein